MRSVVGIFGSRNEAERGIENLRRAGVAPDRINLLDPGSGETEIHSRIETSDTEQPGVGPALGGVVGAVAGGTAGMGLGAAAASLLIPGVGPVAAVGLAAAALFGAGGAIGGVAAGKALENKVSSGIPHDELYLYEDALRQGRAVLFALTDDEKQARAAGRAMEESGAESLDAARDHWWVGLRETEREHYESAGKPFAPAESAYRKGFEAALHPDARGRDFAAEMPRLKERYGDLCEDEEFRRGYQRGMAHATSAPARKETAARNV